MILMWTTRLYVAAVGAISLMALIYIYALPPQSMFSSREGVPHFTPKVAHPETGVPIDVGELIRHYRGD